jgi:transcriptional regulator with XRE-family HTH domain
MQSKQAPFIHKLSTKSKPTMENIYDRLKIIKTQYQLKDNALAKLMGISRQAVGKYWTIDPPTPSDKNLAQLCKNLNLDYNWLRFGLNKQEDPSIVSEPKVEYPGRAPMMNVTSVLEMYFSEIDMIKDMLNLKQDAYKKVIFPNGK